MHTNQKASIRLNFFALIILLFCKRSCLIIFLPCQGESATISPVSPVSSQSGRHRGADLYYMRISG